MLEARSRAGLLTVDGYELDVDLTGGPDTFRSTTTVRFRATPGADTFIELRPHTLRAARLNGRQLDPATLAEGRLPLPGLAADNELVVEADYPYSRSSEGMHRFVDPADGKVYIYAQPSITQAPRFMACFDQPDLKAPVTLRVTADPQWLVRANGAGRQVAPGRWEFAPTPPLATYLITLAAGPYHELRAEHDGIPLGLYARASLAGHLEREAPELFEVTAAGLDYYHDRFGIRYPFGDYDQVFAPEFSWGAMEFPGCVLIRDELVFRSAVTDSERERRAVLIAHEMAHMWFGDLVTMRWWDDLWLNESFADYLGWRVTAEATRFKTAPASYSVSRKSWGYNADQRPSTHPVAPTEVADTDQALANFDGISYAKGSAVLRQLVAWIGDEAFWSGLRSYFQAHAYGNATLADLLTELSTASGRDLTEWGERWLRQSGVDILRPEVTVDETGRYTGVRIIATGPDGSAASRPHRVAVGVYDEVEGVLARRQQVLVDLEPGTEATEVPTLVGAGEGRLLLVNDDDLSYTKIRLAGQGDPLTSLPGLTDPQARALVWQAAWDACRDAELSANRLVELAAAALPSETHLPLYETMFATLCDPLIDRYLPPSQHPLALATLAGVARQVLTAAAPGSGWQLAAARGLLRCAQPADVEWLQRWLSGEVPEGLILDPDLRWSIIERLAVLGQADEALIVAEQERDPSARGQQRATWCRAARPDPAAKAEAWQLITTDRKLSNRLLVAAADGFWQPTQTGLTESYVARFFSEIGATAQWRSLQLLEAVTRTAYPRYAVTSATLTLAEAALADPGLHPVVRREIVDATDDLRRALAARAVASKPEVG